MIGTYGSDDWRDLAYSRAYPSTHGQGFCDVVVSHQPDGSLADARNCGAEQVEADGLVFLDADDELAPGYLEAMRPLAEPRMVIVGSAGPVAEDLPPHLGIPAVQYVHADGTEEPPRIPNEGGWPKINDAVIGTLVSKRLFCEVGGFRELASIEDYDLWLRCWDAGAERRYVREAVYRAHRGVHSRNLDQSVYPKVWADHVQRRAAGASRP